VNNQLVTGTGALNRIADCVKRFCNRFGLNGTRLSERGVTNCGPWQKWPPADPASAEGQTVVAAATCGASAAVPTGSAVSPGAPEGNGAQT